MTNTFIDAGTDTREEILSSMEYGLYARRMGGGQVNPITGAFNFAVTEGYLVREGKVCEPVRGASLIGKGAEILHENRPGKRQFGAGAGHVRRFQRIGSRQRGTAPYPGVRDHRWGKIRRYSYNDSASSQPSKEPFFSLGQ